MMLDKKYQLRLAFMNDKTNETNGEMRPFPKSTKMSLLFTYV